MKGHLMQRQTRPPTAGPDGLAKCATGIRGLDEITEGGFPRGRTTLICGAAGSGKTLLALEFLVRGAREFGEPGALMAFEETASELAQNSASLGFNVNELVDQGKLTMDYVHLERSEIHETGDFDLEGLFVRLNSMIEEVGAKRVVLDTVEALFAGLPNEGILRAELRRLFRWLKNKGVTAVITGEKGENTLTRYGLEEYVSDCVIFLDHRVQNQIATRRLRIVKYRGSRHGVNEYPTLVGDNGLSVLPISSLGLNYPVSSERVSSGTQGLDEMLGGKGFYQGSTVLISGSAGTGKSSLAAAFAAAMCARGERCLYYAFEESAEQMIRNMRSIGIDLGKWVDQGLLQIRASRPSLHGLEAHLVDVHTNVERLEPEGVVLDPITSLTSIGDPAEVRSMLVRLVDSLKNRNITALMTSLVTDESALTSGADISSLTDAWLVLKSHDVTGERKRTLDIVKSRGMGHSRVVHEITLSEDGVRVADAGAGAQPIFK